MTLKASNRLGVVVLAGNVQLLKRDFPFFFKKKKRVEQSPPQFKRQHKLAQQQDSYRDRASQEELPQGAPSQLRIPPCSAEAHRKFQSSRAAGAFINGPHTPREGTELWVRAGLAPSRAQFGRERGGNPGQGQGCAGHGHRVLLNQERCIGDVKIINRQTP